MAEPISLSLRVCTPKVIGCPIIYLSLSHMTVLLSPCVVYSSARVEHTKDNFSLLSHTPVQTLTQPLACDPTENMSNAMTKPAFCTCENKAAQLISAFVFAA